MVDIQSRTAENRRGKKEDRNHRVKYNGLSITVVDHENRCSSEEMVRLNNQCSQS